MIRIRTEPDLYPEAVALLIEHGCEVKRSSTCCEVMLPEGIVPSRRKYWCTPATFFPSLSTYITY
jgi:hypothetical protein